MDRVVRMADCDLRAAGVADRMRHKAACSAADSGLATQCGQAQRLGFARGLV